MIFHPVLVFPGPRKRRSGILSCTACLLVSLPALGQLGPIEPIIVDSGKPSETLAGLPELGGDFTIPVEVMVAADGSVTEVIVTASSGNAAADQVAVSFMREKTFLPALDEKARPVVGRARGTVDIDASTRMRQLKASMKPPDIPTEIARVRKLTCRDFLWEIERLRGPGASTDIGREIMPWVSLRVYMLDRRLPKDAESRYLQIWPQALREAQDACRRTPHKTYFADTLTLILDSLAPNQ